MPRPTKARHHWWRWTAAACAALLVIGVGVFAYLWLTEGARPLARSVAVERFRRAVAGDHKIGPGPAQGVYSYRGSGTEAISVPPKSQSEGPELPGTVVDKPAGCFQFRIDYSDAHWQSWTYCTRDGNLVTSSKAGYYLWNFVAFSVDDTSTYVCHPGIRTVPAVVVVGTRSTVTCTGSNDHLTTGPVEMIGTSTVLRTSTLRVGNARVPGVLVREDVRILGRPTGFKSSLHMVLRGNGTPPAGNLEHRGVHAITCGGIHPPGPRSVLSDLHRTPGLITRRQQCDKAQRPLGPGQARASP